MNEIVTQESNINIDEKELNRRIKIGDKNRGKKHGPKPQHVKDKISKGMQGKNKSPKSEETKLKMSLGKKGKPRPDLKGKPQTEETKHKKSVAMQGKKLIFKDPDERSRKLSVALKGKECPNKGKKQSTDWVNKRAQSTSKSKTGQKLSEETKKKRNLKYYETSKKNHTLGKIKTKAEIKLHNYLISILEEKDIIYQYSSDLYPFKCDFYIKSLDLYIELNANPRHGSHPFNPNNPEDIEELNRLKNDNSSWSKQILVQWPDLDVRKWNLAIKNNLNILVIYSHSKETNKIYFNLNNNTPELIDIINKISMIYSQ